MRERLAEFVVRHRLLVIAVNVALACLFLFFIAAGHIVPDKGLPKLEFESSPEIWFRPTDPARIAYNKLHEYFGDDEFVLAVIEDPNGVFNNKALESVERLTRELEDSPYVNKVQSLTEFQWIHGENDSLLVDELLRGAIDEGGFPLSEDVIKKARDVVMGDPLAVNLLVNPEGTATAIVGRVEHKEGTFSHKVELATHLFEVFKQEETTSGYRVYYAGSPIIDYAFYTYSLQDNATLVPALYGLIILVLFIVFRRWRAVVYPLLVIAITSLVSLGLIPVMETKMQTMTAMLPMILIAVCIADSIHIVVVFLDEYRRLKDRKKAAHRTVVDLFIPCLMTSVTTAIGFGSLCTSEMPPVFEYGLLAAIGVMYAFVVSITFLPALLTFGKPHNEKAGSEKPQHLDPSDPRFRNWTLNLLRGMNRFVQARPKFVLFLTVVLLGISFWGITLIRVETVAIEFFRGKSDIRQNTHAIERLMGGVSNLEIVVNTGQEDGVKDPAILEKVKMLQDYLVTVEGVSKTMSLVDFIKRLNRSLHNEDAKFERIPTQAEFAGQDISAKDYIAQLLLLYTLSDPKEDLSDMVDYPYEHTRVFARTPFLPQERMIEIVEQVRDYIAKSIPGLDAQPTGLMVLYNNMGTYVNHTMRSSFLWALILITISVGIALRSAKASFYSMVPTVLPIIFTLGAMGFTGIRLDVGTVMVAGITLGIAVDDAIHFLARFVEARQHGATTAQAIEHVLVHAGRAIVFTSIILIGGFWMLLFAQFLPTAYLGLISGITIFFALLACLLILPAMLYAFNPDVSKASAMGEGEEGATA